ncbi:MAG: T9SS type A sorting domain-containing protein [Rhodothermales bacterium]
MESILTSKSFFRRSVYMHSVLALCLGITTTLFAQQQILVTNTADAGAGSLRQAIVDANATLGADDIMFSIPNTDAGYNGLWWTITLASPLPDITDSGTRILGSSQTVNQGDTNPGVVGTGGTVGVAELPLPMYELPEIAINASGFDGLSISGAASDIEIEGLSIYGGRNGIVARGDAMIGQAGSNRRIHGVLVGPMPDGSGPGEFSNSGHGIVLEAATSVADVSELTVDSSYVGLNGEVGIVSMLGPSYIEVRASEVFLNGHATDNHDGIDVNGVGAVIEGNLSWGNSNASGIPNPRSGNGIEAGSQQTPGTGNYRILNNTASGNLSGGIGIRAGASFSLVAHNVISENGVGIQVTEDGDGMTAHNRFMENEIFDNEGLGIDLNASGSGDGFDGVTLNSPTSGTAGANLLVPYPVITEAVVTDRVLRIKGFAEAGGLIELYEAAPDPSGFGEGRRFIIALAEGVPGVDLDDSVGTYGPIVNGVTVATEELTAERFEFTYELGDEESDDMVLTATETLPTSPCLSCNQVMSTSEFGPNIQTEMGSNVANETQELPSLFTLHDAYPNPFNPSTTIRFDLEQSTPVSLRVYGADGTERATLVNGTLPAGPHRVDWNAADLPSGIYFFRIEAGGRSVAKSVLLLR